MNDKHKIHFSYIISILIAIIILLVSIKWGQVPNLVDLISFALTITSLVLAILAIAYAVYSNNSFSSNISKLDSASETLVKTSDKISNVAGSFLEQIESIPLLLKSIETKTDTTQMLIGELSKPQKSINANETIDNSISNDMLQGLIYKSSNSGLSALYIIYKSYEKGKAFNLKSVCEICKLQYDYIYGFLVCVISLDLFTYKEIERKEASNTYFDWKVEKVHPAFEKDIPLAIKKNYDENHNDPVMNFLVEGQQRIENYFA